jgi:hypothetical protein
MSRDNARNRYSLFNSIDDNNLDAIDDRNEQLLSAMTVKSQSLLEISRSVKRTLAADRLQLDNLGASMDTGTDLLSKTRGLVAGVADDPTYFGVFKIASVVFWTLIIIYFSLKFGFRLIVRK